MPAREFGDITLAELYDAITGFDKHESAKLQWHLWGIRKQIFYQLSSVLGSDAPREEEIIRLDMDDELIKQRHKNMPLMTVTIDGKPE